ncbi:DNA repair protein RecN [Cognatazoarcus halotolerans]|uniref:DNA repair protein RecN n=1 Tax=Cognatazoarcus halotolerans TaxID=2686016 RepID=UPI00135B71CB|nr:DNA repair protein RecN [Cognatazoarcus halotolerans]MCB1897674.1 DNA repair protein RecN [Rhodocyclaceae bacterium]MCP5309558.1 DNA repair protein RecN [Zoogloeaceae bacterium]
MLRRLQIRDFVIVDRLELEFGGGFGTLTGETGAGKSILLDALGLALGARGEPGVVRPGCERAEVVAEFDLPGPGGLSDWLVAQEVSSEDGCLLLRRVVDLGGRSRGWINGTSVTLAQLREVSEWLVDIHGQHAHHALLRSDAQRSLLDSHGGLEALTLQVGERYHRWQAARSARVASESNAEGLAREREVLSWQLDELRELGYTANGWDELNQEQARLAHGVSLIEGAESTISALTDSDMAIAPVLDRLSARLASMAGVDEGLAPIAELLATAAIQLDEAGHALRRYRERFDLDPARLEELDRRIARISDVSRKYRLVPDALPALLEETERRLADMEDSGDPALLAERERQAEEAYLQVARELSAGRALAADTLSRAVTEAMQRLAMGGGAFAAALLPMDEGGASGLERIEFQVTTNASQPLRPLSKVASGGELSRIGLAIQVIASRSSATPTLIFDEVDVGIGGRVAEIVGQMLRRLGDERQVLCVTHLPQVAAQAGWQWNISKGERDGATLSRVALLDENGRIEEIARMLGGVTITDTTRRHAAEMLGLADLAA